MSVNPSEAGKLDLGVVITGTFQLIGRNIATITVLGLLLSGLPMAIVSYLQFDLVRASIAGAETGNFTFNPATISSGMMGGLASLICSAILQGALIYLAVQDMNGRRASLVDCLATGLRNFLPLIGLSILFALSLAFGFVLLVVPGFMLLCAWCVAIPSLIADRTGVFGAFGRSSELTRGNRWRIFGLVVILWLAFVVIGTVFNAVVGVGTFGDFGVTAVERLLSPMSIVLLAIRSAVTSVIVSTGAAVLYFELRRARGSLGPQWLAEVFA